jgi:hypothetical protein
MAVGQARFGGSGVDPTLCCRCCPHTLRNSVTTTPWPRTDALAWHLSGGGNFVHHVDDDVLSECVFVNRSSSLSRKKKWTNTRVRKTRSWKRGNTLDKWLQPPRSIDEKVKIKAPQVGYTRALSSCRLDICHGHKRGGAQEQYWYQLYILSHLELPTNTPMEFASFQLAKN